MSRTNKITTLEEVAKISEQLRENESELPKLRRRVKGAYSAYEVACDNLEDYVNDCGPNADKVSIKKTMRDSAADDYIEAKKNYAQTISSCYENLLKLARTFQTPTNFERPHSLREFDTRGYADHSITQTISTINSQSMRSTHTIQSKRPPDKLLGFGERYKKTREQCVHALCDPIQDIQETLRENRSPFEEQHENHISTTLNNLQSLNT